MKLSKRLKAIGDMVPYGKKVADVGCDHGLLSFYLEEERGARVIASDISSSSIEKIETLKKLDSSIVAVRSDGIDHLEVGEVDFLIMSGMGGLLMIKILEKKRELAKSFEGMVLSPQRDSYSLRKYLHCLGFSIIDERLVEERGHFYEIICLRRGRESYEKEVYYYFGRIPLEKKDPILIKKILIEREKKERILKNMVGQKGEKTRKRRGEIERELGFCQEALGICAIENL